VEGVELVIVSKEGDPIVEGVNAKRCSCCGELKPLSEFSFRKSKQRHVSQCKACVADYNKRYRGTKKAAEWEHNRILKRYGITEQHWKELMVKQDGRCHCCGADLPARPGAKRLAVDHCHETGEVRGNCNTGIGKLGDNLEGVLQAAVYLSKAGLQHPSAREAVTNHLREIILNVGGLSLLRHLDTTLALEAELLDVPEVSD
jgi:hypothetical protein